MASVVPLLAPPQQLALVLVRTALILALLIHIGCTFLCYYSSRDIYTSGTISGGTVTSSGYLSVTGNLLGITQTTSGVHSGLPNNYATIEMTAPSGGYLDFGPPNVDFKG